MRCKHPLIMLTAFILVSIHLAHAQSTKVSRIGYMSGGSSSSSAPFIEAFRQGLRELGYVEGRNITVEERFAASPCYEWEVRAFEDERKGKRSLLPDGGECTQVVAVTQAVLASVVERRAVSVDPA